MGTKRGQLPDGQADNDDTERARQALTEVRQALLEQGGQRQYLQYQPDQSRQQGGQQGRGERGSQCCCQIAPRSRGVSSSAAT